MYKQVKTPNYDPVIYQNGKILTNWLGYCLAYVQYAYGVGWAGATATAAWLSTSTKHRDYNLPSGVAVPIYFDHWGDYGYGYQNYGHIAIYKDGKIYSSPISAKYTADVWNSIQEVERNYRSKYIGWSEYVGPYMVLEGSQSVSDTSRMTAVKCYARNTPDTKEAPFQEIDKGAIVELKGYVTNGQAIDGNTTWFVTAKSGKYISAECFIDKLVKNLPNLTPSPTTPLAPTQRKAVAEGANIRRVPSIKAEVVKTTRPGEIVDMKGWTKGDSVNGSDEWYVLQYQEPLYSHVSAYTNTSVKGLPQIITDQNPAEEKPQQEDKKDPSQFIVDVSSFQNDSIMPFLSKFAGVIIRAGHVGPSYGGNEYKHDPKLKQFAQAAGDKLLGIYWIPYFSNTDPEYSPEKEAERFAEAAKLTNAPLLFVDLEPDFEGDIVQLLTFKNKVLQKTGKSVLTYAGNAIKTKLELRDVDWYPNYNTYKDYSQGNAIHQFTDKGQIEGYNGNLDLSTSKVSIEELKKMFAAKPNPAKPTQPENPKTLPEEKTIPTVEPSIWRMINILVERFISWIIKKIKKEN